MLYTGLFGITMGDTTTPECTDPSSASNKAMDVFKGDMLIVAGQVVMAFQGVYEEKVLNQYNVHPILAVAWEVRASPPNTLAGHLGVHRPLPAPHPLRLLAGWGGLGPWTHRPLRGLN